jgi:hypothetical protein
MVVMMAAAAQPSFLINNVFLINLFSEFLPGDGCLG